VVAAEGIRRGDIYVLDPGPTRGGEIRQRRPCLVVSPNELNRHLRAFIVAPLTSSGRAYPFRIPCRFGRRNGHVVLDQIRTVDRDRLVRRLGRLSPATTARALAALQEMFSP